MISSSLGAFTTDFADPGYNSFYQIFPFRYAIYSLRNGKIDIIFFCNITTLYFYSLIIKTIPSLAIYGTNPQLMSLAIGYLVGVTLFFLFIFIIVSVTHVPKENKDVTTQKPTNS